MEELRMVVQDEGKSAKHSIAFHVPLNQTQLDSGKVLVRKPPSSPRPTTDSKKEDPLQICKRAQENLKPGPRVRSASTGRDKKSELQARYWAFLFGNLQRAVDEIYQTCETDESVSECKEVILVLDNYTRDFHNLIEWFKLKWEYENTPPPQRPTSYAWEVRKSSPGKARNIPVVNKFERTVQGPSSSSVEAVKQEETVSVKVSPVGTQETSSNVNSTTVPELSTDIVEVHTADNEDAHQAKTDPVRQNDSKVAGSAVEGVEVISRIGPQTDTLRTEADDKGISDLGDVLARQRDACAETVKSTQKETHIRKDDEAERCSETPVDTSDVPKCEKICSDVKSSNGVSSMRHTSQVTEGSNFREDKGTSTCSLQDEPGGLAPSESEVVMVHQASQTDMEQCVEDSDGIRFVSIVEQPAHECDTSHSQCAENNAVDPANAAESTVVKVSTSVPHVSVAAVPTASTSSTIPGPALSSVSAPPAAASTVVPAQQPAVAAQLVPPSTDKTSMVSGRTLLQLSKPSARTSSAPLPRSQSVSSTRPPYSAVSRSATPRIAPISARAVAPGRGTTAAVVAGTRGISRPGMSPQPLPRGLPSPHLVRSRTSTDVRFGRGTSLQRPVMDASSKVNRTPLAPRQAHSGQSASLGTVRATRQLSSDRPQVRTPNQQSRQACGIPGKENLVRTQKNSPIGSSSSLNSSTSSDKVKQPTTVSVEVLPRTADDDDTQGWETVKGRSRSSRVSPTSKVAAGQGLSRLSGMRYRAQLRFNQPTAASSLPALALSVAESSTELTPVKEQRKKTNNVSSFRTASETKKFTKMKERDVNTHQKSHNGKNSNHVQEKSKSSGSQKKLNSEKPAIDGPVSVEITIESKNTDCELSLSNEDDSNHTTEAIKNLRNIENGKMILESKFEDILEEKHLFNEEELRKSKELCAEEEMLRKKIHELQSTEIEVDTETDETETDGEATTCPEDENGRTDEEIGVDSMSLEARYENILEGMSWSERMDALEQLQELVARHPGRALELHQKLSSPSRRRTVPETLRRFQAKQAQAEEKREKLKLERSQRLRELLNKVEEVKAAQAQLIEDKRNRLEMKLKRAEVNRKLHLQGIVRKAHDEEEKLKEIAFITELSAQNKRHDFMAQCQEQEERLQGIHEERQRKQEEKAAKEAAAEERRRLLEAERQERLEKMQELRRKREERVGRKQQEKEKERQEHARERARDREERLSALHAAQLANQEELQKKIQQKQEDSARRHEENIEQIRQKALESSILRYSTDDLPPRLAPYETLKLCEICNVLIGSEVYLLSHLRGRQHQEALQQKQDVTALSREELLSFSITHIVDAPADKIDPRIALDKERQKALKKRCKKIRLRMASRGQEYESKREIPQKIESPNKVRLQKCLRDVEKLHNTQGKGQWPNNAVTALERALGEVNRILSKQNTLDQLAFQALNGFTVLSNMLNLAMDVPPNMAPYLSSKCYVTVCTSYTLACQANEVNCKYVLFSNKVSTVLDLLHHRLTELIPDRGRGLAVISASGNATLPVDNLAGALMKLLALVLTHAASPEDGPKDDVTVRIQDVISYTVSLGVVDRLAAYCGGVRDPIDNDPNGANFLLAGLELLSTLAARCSGAADGGTQLSGALQVTELVGAVSMLYGALLRQGAPAAKPPPPLPPHTVSVALATFRLLGHVAELHLPMFQSVLGAEGISLQFRHIASYLLWYCSHASENDLLHEVVRVVGFFAVRNPDNQMMLQSGNTPTVLQQLCGLPLAYFSRPELSALLFPTLLACCSGNQQNRAILEQEVSYQLLEEFRQSEAAKKSRLVALLDANSDA
ncbi:S phase cyclin A-associated protein in the endoplasmic reticulum isoform X1 [Schistocerca serialis cubense]|uniref:S phase cyclin A-associated protein in the endoplasmic reticulum isoform X1 n=1 Tax=Schistocerca serialis cubense TaxID=2023355 RepID=UPI00214E8AE6|nr:S phase cyclin A-associated protein in the endoplasmic reticulum isoform X1 [Schistocerca serialis cubense]